MKRVLFFSALAFSCLTLATDASAGTVSTLSGDTLPGTVTADDRGLVVSGDGNVLTKVGLADILEARIADADKDKTDEDFPGGVILVNGTAVPKAAKKPLSLTDLTLAGKPLTLREPQVAKYVYEPVKWNALQGDTGDTTGVQLRSGDFLAATIGSVTDTAVNVNSVIFGPRKFNLKKSVAAIVVRPVQADPAAYRIRTLDGTLFMVDNPRLSSSGISFRDSVLGPITLPIDQIASISAGPGRFARLETLKPARVDLPKGLLEDQALTRRKAGSATDSKPPAIIVAANAAVSYLLPPGFTIFNSQIAIPSDAPKDVPFYFAIYTDGRPAYRSPAMTSSNGARAVRVNLGSARHVTLRIETDSPMPSGVVGEWLEPMLLKTSR